MSTIKMGTRSIDDGVATVKKMDNGIKLNTVTVGMKVAPKVEKPKAVKLERIELDIVKISKLIEIAVADLKTKRLMTIDGTDKEINFIKEFNPKSRVLQFNYSINQINYILKTKETDLSDFFLTFMFNNLHTYVKNEWNAIPEMLPILSVEEANIDIPNTIIINIR